jgi:hypothetical protein
MSASAPVASDEGAGALLEPEDEGMLIDDIGLEVADDPASVLEEPHEERPRARAGTTARRVILRVMCCLQIRRPTRRPRSGIRCDGTDGLVRAHPRTRQRDRTNSSGPSVSVELRGFEPLAFSLRTRRATNCATAP